MDVFNKCKIINTLIIEDNENEARDEIIKLLDYLNSNNIAYTPLVNHLIRQVGLYPYLDLENSLWEDRFVYDAFKVDVGEKKPLTLHREQSALLKKIISGQNIAVSAPTSFGKSFIIDAFITINKPNNVMIIVPTIALADETRRRIYKKFSPQYKVITTADVELEDKNIFIFPQERAVSYIDKIDSLDILIIDEFYKASITLDKQNKDRASILLKIIEKFGKIAKQKYFLAPNISTLKDNPFTKDMKFEKIDFNTVFLQIYPIYEDIGDSNTKKKNRLIKILKKEKVKTLIYAGTYPGIEEVSSLLLKKIDNKNESLLNNFSDWLKKNYSDDYELSNLVKLGIGIHNGQLHRSLSQIQVKLFEEINGLDTFITTSSIIEGVNTSTENIVIWKNKNGNSKLDIFTYRNIIGRSGRMFKHFIGKAYILDTPPKDVDTELNIEIPEDSLSNFDSDEYQSQFTQEQINKIIEYKETMNNLLGKENYKRIIDENLLQNNPIVIQKIAEHLFYNEYSWNGLSNLNSSKVDMWDTYLYHITKEFMPYMWNDLRYKDFVEFIKILFQNGQKTIKDLLELNSSKITMKNFFQLERSVTYTFASLASDLNILQKIILKDKGYDIAPFVSSLSNAFLPPVLYQLEEYGLPRMITKTIHRSKIIDFNNRDLTIHSVIDIFNDIGLNELLNQTKNLDKFDKYIIEYFYDGIRVN